jgi:uncharacterized membrane protein (DUF4010 family)
MSRASLVRLAVGFGGVLVGLLIARNVPNPWIGIPAIIVVFLVSGLLAERAYRRLASQEEQRLDLEDRVRNPPA